MNEETRRIVAADFIRRHPDIAETISELLTEEREEQETGSLPDVVIW